MSEPSIRSEYDFDVLRQAWTEWSNAAGVERLNLTEALRFFGFLSIERPDLLDFSCDEKTQWQVVLGYLKWAFRDQFSQL